MIEILSPISGKVVAVNVNAGDNVTEDDEAFILEAMKMENAVFGENGVVKEILVKVGDSVAEDQVLAVLE